jgi:hypothetical protein
MADLGKAREIEEKHDHKAHTIEKIGSPLW